MYLEDRRVLVHDLVDRYSLDVLDWGGGGDRIGPGNEDWHLIIQIATPMLGPAAALIAAWLGRPRESRKARKPTVRLIHMKRSDGAEIEFRYEDESDPKVIAAAIRESLSPAGPSTDDAD